MKHPQPFIIMPPKTHTHTLILLHGLSTNGLTFGTDLVHNALNTEGSTLPQVFPHTKFVFPSGASRRCTAFGGKLMHVWFDITKITDRTIGEDQQVEGLVESTTYLCRVIKEEIAILELLGQSKENVVIGGFSQGCAMSIWVLLSIGLKLGGFVGMSGWLPFRKQIDNATKMEEDRSARRLHAIDLMSSAVPVPYLSDFPASEKLAGFETPVFLGHGMQDMKVQTAWGIEMRETLEYLGLDITWKGYEGLEHWYRVPDEFEDIAEFLRSKVMEKRVL